MSIIYYEDIRRKCCKTLGLFKHKCEMCGKEFECTKDYVYKIAKKTHSERYYYYCSYTCFRKAQKEKERNNRNDGYFL